MGASRAGVRIEDLVGRLSTAFGALGPDGWDASVPGLLGELATFLDLDLCILWQPAFGLPGVFGRTHVWRAAALAPLPDPMWLHDHLPWCAAELAAGRTLVLPSPEALPEGAARDRAGLQAWGVSASLALPLAVGGGSLAGVLALHSRQVRRSWSAAEVQGLEVIAQALANALARRSADQALRVRDDRLSMASQTPVAGSDLGFRATFEQAPVGVAHVGLDGRFLRVNAAFCAFLDLAKQRVLEGNLLDVVGQVQSPSDTAQVHQLLRGEIDTVSRDRRYVRPSGGVVWGHVTVSLVRDALGKPDWFVVILQDVTAQRTAEEELSRLHGQLWHADRAAQVGVLSASLAHELNQPLSAILTNAQAGLRFLTMETPDLEEIRTILEDVAQDAKRAGTVVSSLRAMLRRRAPLRESVRLADTLRELLGLLRTELLDRKVKVSMEADPEVAIAGDRTQIQQVTLNLLMNAMDAMRDLPEHARHVELTVSRNPRGQAEVAVRDHGPGVSDEQHRRMFEAFWTTKESGMGIGLAISRSIVESHGGRLWCRNHPEGGATFVFALPAEEARRG